MKKEIRTTAAAVLCGSFLLYGDVVTFNSPGSWATLRTDKIVAKMQIDTAKVEKKKIKLNLISSDDGKEKNVSSKLYNVNDYSQEFELAELKTGILGGKKFLKIKWEIPGTKKAGETDPFGIVKLEDGEESADLISAKAAGGPITAADLKGSLSDADFTSLSSSGFCVVWSDKALGIVFKKSGLPEGVLFCIDGKNGKNAFLSFPDRMIRYYTAKDSLKNYYFKRKIASDKISYDEKAWHSEISKSADADIAVVTVPWSDLGMLPFDNRVIGFSAFALDEKGEAVSSFPAKAEREIPGTWASLKFVK